MSATRTTAQPPIRGKTEPELAQMYANLWRDQSVDRNDLNWQIIGQIGQSGMQRVFAAAWAIVQAGEMA